MDGLVALLNIICACLELLPTKAGRWLWALFTSEWVGFLGASVMLVFSLGRIQWENKDSRSAGTGTLLILCEIGLLARWLCA